MMNSAHEDIDEKHVSKVNIINNYIKLHKRQVHSNHGCPMYKIGNFQKKYL